MKERYYFIDWLRVIAIILILFFHVGMIFCKEWGWHIKNNQTSNIVLEFNFWLSRFRMPLLFFISGAGAYWALRKRTIGRFLKERHNRLIIPLIFSMLVIVPPQVYFERLLDGDFSGNFFQFFPSIFTTGPYPHGNMSWNHMWFVLYLFIYSAIALPIFLMLKNNRIQERIRRIKWFNSSFGLYLLIIPTLLLYLFWTIKFPRTSNLVEDWGYLPYWFTYFFVGYFISSAKQFWSIIEKNRKNLLKFAIISIVVLNYLRWNKIEPLELYGENWQGHFFSYFYLILFPINSWLWLLAAVGYGKKYLNKNHKILAYANRGIYPFYILHQTVIIAIGYYVVNLEESIFIKYLFVSLLSLVLTVAIYDFLIRPFKVSRFLFGVKEIKKKPRQVEKNIETMVKVPELKNIAS